MPDLAYRYKFCGFPIGISMLPRFAAIVCITTTGMIRCSFSDMESTMIANGTKVISETSFVINILNTNGSNTSTRNNCLVV